MKKLVALLLALVLCVAMTCAVAEAKKPEKITIMADTTIFPEADGRIFFEEAWEAETGIDLEIIQPDHSAYYDVLQQTIASGEWPDVMILSSTYYSSYASAGVLWDMTEAWENSKTKNSGRWIGDTVIDGLKIGGSLYGFAPTRGNGCVTYVKQAWLDAVGMEAPKTYDEYIAMCDAFVNKDPDGDGVKDTFAVSAAGFIGAEAPFVNYLPEFYWDAYPFFVKQEDGTWVDGFELPNMKDALARLTDAYAKGYIDPTTLTNATKDARNKFYDDEFGVFTYWAGTWATNLKTNLEAKNLSGELVALPPLAEAQPYYDRVPPVWAISSMCENPEGVFEYFIDTMMDGGDIQMLWTYGVEGKHWSKAAETVLGKEYAEGQFHMLESMQTAGTAYTKHHIDPMLSLATFAEGFYDPKEDSVKPEAKAASELFGQYSKLASIVPTTDEMSMYNGDLTTLKNELIAKVIMGDLTYEDAMAKYEADGGKKWSDAIVKSLNAL